MDEFPTHYGIKNMLWGKAPPLIIPEPVVDRLRGAATISDLEWVRAIAKLRILRSNGNYSWVMVGDLADELNIHPNRIRSKMRRAGEKRRLSDGCNCGCRGDVVLLPAGEDLLYANIEVVSITSLEGETK